MTTFEVSNNLMHTFVFTFSWLPRHLKKWFYTVFDNPSCKETKIDKICILGLELANVLTKVQLGITFLEIKSDLVIL